MRRYSGPIANDAIYANKIHFRDKHDLPICGAKTGYYRRIEFARNAFGVTCLSCLILMKKRGALLHHAENSGSSLAK